MHLRTLVLSLALGSTALLAAPRPVFAQQVSDADRKAARDLYNDGYQLQQAGKNAEALDRYQRSLAVYPAPTTALHVAQCKAALGKLVEAAEDYRAIAGTTLPAGSPAAFQQAKDQAVIELGQVEPRIPHVKI